MTSEIDNLRVRIEGIEKLSKKTKAALKALGYEYLGDLEGAYFPQILKLIPLAQSKVLLRQLKLHAVTVKFAMPDWDEEQWHQFVDRLVTSGIVSWKEVAIAVCGELNPPQVGTAIASNKSFQANCDKEAGKKKQTMRMTMEWFYQQSGKCEVCKTRLFLEADHIKSKQSFRDAGLDPKNADRISNLQLLCKRCNVIKRPSHELGGISFAPAQSVLMWILLELKPTTKQDFYKLCRNHGLTMANIRFDEAWAFAEWLRREGKY